MASGCRDCRTCTKSWLGRMCQKAVYLFCFAWLVKPVFMRNCPQCKHLMGRHARRRDGSFQD
ncbi:hypothetical protein CP979_05165 [Streptomyces filamentosus]|nr:hypothetical protein CP979_05165 [Streptomyces filamentosus]